MTRKKAIKIIMAVTQNGDRRWANYAFDAAKGLLPGIRAMLIAAFACFAISRTQASRGCLIL